MIAMIHARKIVVLLSVLYGCTLFQMQETLEHAYYQAFYPRHVDVRNDHPLEMNPVSSRVLQQNHHKSRRRKEVWVQPSRTYSIDASDQWESGHSIPDWMKSYFRWHKEQTSSPDWKNNDITSLPKGCRFLYVTCLKEYRKCGGTADRLLSVPFFVKVAALTHRVLIIRWTKPSALEEYLVPPVGGIDWRVPHSKVDVLQSVGERAGTQDTILESVQNETVTVVQVKFQSHDHGAIYYDSITESESEPDFQSVFHSVWNVLFTPAPALATEIENSMHTAGLVPGQYSGAHVRALYNTDKRDAMLVQQWSTNAVKCAVQLQLQNEHSKGKGDPVYFASDSQYAVQQANAYGRAMGQAIISRTADDNPLHLDKTKDWAKRPASDFYSVFVDLYTMGLANCVTYGMGGFGLFASLLSQNSTCSLVHMTATSMTKCKNLPRRKRGLVEHKPQATVEIPHSYFLSPMP